MSSFAAQSSIHAIHLIFNPSQAKLTRFFWSFALTCSFCGFCFYIYGAFVKLHIYPDTVLKVTQRPMNELPFPAITFCNPIFSKLNFVSSRKFMDNTFYCANNPKPSNECSHILANSHWCKSPSLVGISICCSPNETIDIVKLLDESSMDPKDLIFNEFSPRFTDDFGSYTSALIKYDKVLTDRGFCYTSNMQNHDVIFNDVISKDFDSYKRKILQRVTHAMFFGVMEEPFEDKIFWTLENGYPTGFLKLIICSKIINFFL